MRFFGTIEANSKYPFMLYNPILGLGMMNDGRYCIGPITGDLIDLQIGHISSGVRNDYKNWIEELKLIFSEGFPKDYKLAMCSYSDACKKTLEVYDKMDYLPMGPVNLDLTLIKNKLRNIIQSQ